MPEPFKTFISPKLVALTARILARHVSTVDADRFAAPLISQLDALELKQRVDLVAEALHRALPTDPTARQAVLLAMLHPDEQDHATKESDEAGLCGWGIWPLTTVIGRYGLGTMEQALATLRDMTKRGTAEFDVRPFIAQDPEHALRIMASWIDDPNLHVRRLISEGTRPRLPWGMRLHALIERPELTLPLLTRLRDDPSDYVRRSVANHLNDIAKDHPNRIARLAHDWMDGASPDRARLVRHACRTLIKQGHPGALATFGFAPPQIAPPHLRIATPIVDLGAALEFGIHLRSTSAQEQQIALDYVIHHRKAHGGLSPKVFKWTTLTLAPGAERRLERRHPIRPITTRTYYAGEHAVSLRINGQDFGREAFTLRLD